MGGATSAPMRPATAFESAAGIIVSVASGVCGPCCSSEPTGRMTTGLVSRTQRSYAVQLISAISVVPAMSGLPGGGALRPRRQTELLGESSRDGLDILV